jgi:hypothetical protein
MRERYLTKFCKNTPQKTCQITTSNLSYFFFRETRSSTGNNLYQELSFQDSEALVDVDEGADITGESHDCLIMILINFCFSKYILKEKKEVTAIQISNQS